MQNEERFSYLFQLYTDDNCSTEELEELLEWVEIEPNRLQLLPELEELWGDADSNILRSDCEPEPWYLNLTKARNLNPVTYFVVEKDDKLTIWPRIVIAVVILTTLLLAFLFHFFKIRIIFQNIT